MLLTHVPFSINGRYKGVVCTAWESGEREVKSCISLLMWVFCLKTCRPYIEEIAYTDATARYKDTKAIDGVWRWQWTIHAVKVIVWTYVGRIAMQGCVVQLRFVHGTWSSQNGVLYACFPMGVFTTHQLTVSTNRSSFAAATQVLPLHDMRVRPMNASCS